MIEVGDEIDRRPRAQAPSGCQCTPRSRCQPPKAAPHLVLLADLIVARDAALHVAQPVAQLRLQLQRLGALVGAHLGGRFDGILQAAEAVEDVGLVGVWYWLGLGFGVGLGGFVGWGWLLELGVASVAISLL